MASWLFALSIVFAKYLLRRDAVSNSLGNCVAGNPWELHGKGDEVVFGRWNRKDGGER